MLIKQSAIVLATMAIWALVGCGAESIEPGGAGSIELPLGEAPRVVTTIDHAVSHISTVPANAGDPVDLFVRERDGGNRGNGQAVLMIHSRSIPVLASYDLATSHYDWALWLAQSGGFDVFMLDFQGSGRSPRPQMDDPCNVPAAQQTSLLIPNPLVEPCAPSYPYTLNTIGSDLDELDAVVEYIRHIRGVDKVHLVSYSQGSFRVGPYAAKR
jgi:pimeloyl-ACP methyl ester carboxylesterase